MRPANSPAPSRSNAKRLRILPALVVLSSIFARTYLPYLLLGLFNRLMTRSFESVFIVYAGSSRYRSHYAYGVANAMFRWCPTPVGVLRQGGKLGLILGTSMTEAEFLCEKNLHKFHLFQHRVRRIARLLGVRTINMAGILPSVLKRQGAEFISDPRVATRRAINEALTKLFEVEFAGTTAPIILLGGNGFIGKAVQAQLLEMQLKVFVVDPRGGLDTLPNELRGQRAILLDVARHGAIAAYVEQMWDGLIVLNETFPEPSRTLLGRLHGRGIKVFHLAGVEGDIIPPLPYAYRGAVPCCAVHSMQASLRPKLILLSAP